MNNKIKFKHITWKEYKKVTENPTPEIIAQCEIIKKIMDSRKKSNN